MKLLCTSTSVLFTRPVDPPEIMHNGIVLPKRLTRDVDWVTCVAAGPDSVLAPGDQLLVSHRVTSFKFKHEDVEYYNTSDKSVIAYMRPAQNNALYCTGTHVVAEWLPDEHPGSIIHRPQLEEVGWARVHAAGPDSGVVPGVLILIGKTFDEYEFIHHGKKLKSVPGEAIICWREEEK